MPVQMTVEIFDAGPVERGYRDCPCPDTDLLILEDELRRLYRELGPALRVHRYWLGLSAANYREFPAVYALIKERGLAVLPVTMVDGRVVRTGSYPQYRELEPYYEESRI